MDDSKRKRLEAQGGCVTTVQDFLGLSDEEMVTIDHLVAYTSGVERFEQKVLNRSGACERIDALKQAAQDAPTKLWLDDLRPAPDDTWQTVKTAQEAIDALQRSFFDIVSLDHDLGEPENGTGYDVLVWLERAVAEGDWCTAVPELRIHSANPVGRTRMAMAIDTIERLASNQ